MNSESERFEVAVGGGELKYDPAADGANWALGGMAAIDVNGWPYATLRKNECWRKGHNRVMRMGMDCLHSPHVRAIHAGIRMPALAGGMNRIDRNRPIKNLPNRYAIGLPADLPSIAYGKAFRELL